MQAHLILDMLHSWFILWCGDDFTYGFDFKCMYATIQNDYWRYGKRKTKRYGMVLATNFSNLGGIIATVFHFY